MGILTIYSLLELTLGEPKVGEVGGRIFYVGCSCCVCLCSQPLVFVILDEAVLLVVLPSSTDYFTHLLLVMAIILIHY